MIRLEQLLESSKTFYNKKRKNLNNNNNNNNNTSSNSDTNSNLLHCIVINIDIYWINIVLLLIFIILFY